MNDLEIIKNKVNIEELAESFGIHIANHRAKCPFHNDNTPSLQFYPDSNSFYCFGCGVGGDIFDLVMLKDGIDFPSAIQRICEQYGIPFANSLRNYRNISSKQNGLNLAYEKYKHKADAERLDSWAKTRNIDIQVLRDIGAIFIPGNCLIAQADTISRIEWEALCSAGLIFKNFTCSNDDERQLKLNLGFIPAEIFYYPGILFPIRNSDGDISGFAFRAAEPHSSKIPKYKYNKFFARDENLWGIERLLDAVASHKKANKKAYGAPFDIFLVEGIMDAIRLQERGFNAIAIFGTHLSGGNASTHINKHNNQIEIVQNLIAKLKNYTVKLHVFLDNDSAGIAAAHKAFWKLLDVANEYGNFQFDYVFFSPQLHGKDPDEILREIPQSSVLTEIKKHVYAATTFILSAEIGVEPTELKDSWEHLNFWDRQNIISRLRDKISPKTFFDFNVLQYYGFANDEHQITEGDASCYLIKEFSKRASSAISSPNPVLDSRDREANICWEEAIQKARESYSTEDFPIDQMGWGRFIDGLDILREHLESVLRNGDPIEPYTPTVLPRNPQESPRLLTLPSQEDLIIETAVLLEIFRYAYSHPGSIPITLSVGKKLFTYNTKHTEELPTVSFAYQYNANTSALDRPYEAAGIFKNFAKCWEDYNNFIAGKIHGVPAGIDCFCYRLDIHRYYDSISSQKLSTLLANIFTGELLEQMVPCCPAIEKIVRQVGQGPSEYANSFIQWVMKRTFSWDYYSPDTWEPLSKLDSERGIPQGPNLSAWLANIFLFDLDFKLHDACIKIHDEAVAEGIISEDADIAWYARYVDDIIIVAPNKEKAERLKALVQAELEKKELVLSVKIDEELIHGKEKLYEFVKKNRGMATAPYGGENFAYQGFDAQGMEFAIWAGNLDRKNFLTYIYSDDSFEKAFGDPDALFDLLKSAIYNSEEIRYRDYRRIVALIIYSIVNAGANDCPQKLVDIFTRIIYKPLLNEKEHQFDGLQKIYACWQLFSIYEGIQKILVKRYDLMPSLSVQTRKKIADVRSKVAEMILQDDFLLRLKKLIVSGENSTFASLIDLWCISLKSSSNLILRSNRCSLEKSRFDFVRFELGMRKNGLPQLTRPANLVSGKYKSIFTAFHILIHALKNNISIKLDYLVPLFGEIEKIPLNFQLLCEHGKDDVVSEPNDSQSVFDALSTFARVVSSSNQFSELQKRHNLFCEMISMGNPVCLIPCPNNLTERHVLALELQEEKIVSIKLILPLDSSCDVSEHIFPPQISGFVKETDHNEFALKIYKADTSSLNMSRYAPSAITSQAQLREIKNCYHSLNNYNLDLPNLVLSSRNLILLDNNIVPLAWQSTKKIIDFIITRNNTILKVPQNFLETIKAGCVALNAVGLDIHEPGDVLEKIMREIDFNYEQNDWIFDFLIEECRLIFSGKNCYNKYPREAYLSKIKNFWLTTDEMSQKTTAISRICCFLKFRSADLRYVAEQKWERQISDGSTIGKTIFTAQYVASHLLPHDANFINYLGKNFSPNPDSTFQICGKRKNVVAWLSLEHLIKLIFIQAGHDSVDYESITYAFKLTAFFAWIKNLALEFSFEDAFRYDDRHINDLIIASNLEQEPWSFEDDIQRSLPDRLERFVSLAKHFYSIHDIEKITPLGWSVLACIKLSHRDFPVVEICSVLTSSKNYFDVGISTQLSSQTTDALTLLASWENQNRIETFVNKGVNPLSGSFRNCLGYETNLKPWQRSFTSLSRQDRIVENESRDNTATYFWTETWRDNQIQGISCISMKMREYISLLHGSAINMPSCEPPKQPIESSNPRSIGHIDHINAKDSPDDKRGNQIYSECGDGSIDQGLVDDINQTQGRLWSRRGRGGKDAICNKNCCRIALLQFDIGHSSYCPVESEIDHSQPPDINSLLVADSDHIKDSSHTKKILGLSLEACKNFDVDILLLPEYSVHPEHIEFIVNRLRDSNSSLMVWAGTFRVNDKNWPSRLKTICKDEQCGFQDIHFLSSVLCVVSKDGILYYRGKKYPSIALNEDFAPWTEDLYPLFQDTASVGSFVTELICSEIFMATSPANILSLKLHHEMLRKKHRVPITICDEKKYFHDLVVNDLLSFSKNVGFVNQDNRDSRRSILFVPAMTTRADDFHILGKANFLAANLCSVFCNGVSNALKTYGTPQGKSCFIGYESTIDKPTFPHTPYSGFEPGILSPNGSPLTSSEEALVIADVDPVSTSEGKPRPQLLPRPLNLVAHIPFIKLDSLRCDGDINKVLREFVKLFKRIREYYVSRDDSNDTSLKDDVCKFWDEQLRNIIPSGNDHIRTKFDALKIETARNVSTFAFSALIDICFYKE